MSIVVVAGALANKPGNAGEAWVRLSWVRGLRRLGFDVLFVEQLAPGALADYAGPAAESPNAAWFRAVTRAFGLDGRAALLDPGGEVLAGPALGVLEDACDGAALLVNISGNLRHSSLLERFPRRAYVDLDPGFTQIWRASGAGGAGLEGHHHFFTVGGNLGTPGCGIPADGLPWRPMAPPVVLDDWPVANGRRGRRFTTIATWRGAYGPVSYGGRTFGLKAHEFRKYLDLPGRVDADFELALAIHPADHADIESLAGHGWCVEHPGAAVPDPDAFRSYVSGSTAEFSVAQGIYVETSSGWFSDRSTRYLASGRPVLLQDTGFSHNYPTGEGLVAFRTLDEAVAGARRILRDYESHRRAARELAETHFDSDRVLSAFVDAVGVAP